MPRYRLLYRVEGALRFPNDTTLQNGAYSVRFLAADPHDPEAAVLAQVELETATHDEAWRLAAGTVIPPALDALSFAAGAPMLLRDCELTLKSEAGNRTRRGIYVRQLRYPNALFVLDAEIINRGQHILNTDGPKLPLCWLRYSHQRELALEKYVFAWLGLGKL